MRLTNLPQWQNDKVWADNYFKSIRNVIYKVTSLIVKVEVAPDQEDKENATDYKITLETGNIACRVRRPSCKYRDLTIRATRTSGSKTELEKIKEGYARWYLYAWAKDNVTFDAWIFVDLDKLRKSDLLSKEHQIISNPDGETGFVALSLNDLFLNDCIIAEGMKA
jgi:hypothetical protein